MSRHPNCKPFRVSGNRQDNMLPSATTPKAKEALREQIETDIEAFKARGGSIVDADIKPRPEPKGYKKNRMGRNW